MWRGWGTGNLRWGEPGFQEQTPRLRGPAQPFLPPGRRDAADPRRGPRGIADATYLEFEEFQ